MLITVYLLNTSTNALLKNTNCVSKLSKYSQTVGQNNSKSYKNDIILYKMKY